MEKRPENFQQGIKDSSAVKKNGKVLIWVLSALAVILAGILATVTVKNNRLVGELNDEKTELTEQIKALQSDYESLSSDYDSINSQLDSSREEVNQLVQRIQKTDATNRAKIRQYQKELGTLRSIMRNYIVQIDSLNTLNHKLTADAAAARKESAFVKKQNEELQKTVDDLSDKVETGSVIRGRNIRAEAYNKNGKVVERSGNVSYLLVSVSLTENALAPQGPLKVYAIVTDPDGNVITNAESVPFDGVQTSASREVDYQGSEVDLGIYVKDIAKFVKGVYSVKVITEQTTLGTAQFMLR